MLLEVIKSRPHLIMPRTTISKAFVVLTLAMLWRHMVNTLLMSLKVIDVWEARLPLATNNSTHMLFLVPSHMFSSGKDQPCSVVGGEGEFPGKRT